ncbi:MAG: hypothetical protein KatS3mg031_1644 [Chitinophagales bacterium]|nr:MAG: hypothetical protein KatS3mg031_1644 [Chitinophagales bacterium]
MPQGSNLLKIALRNAANAIGNLKDSTPLRDFFQRISFRKGRMSAISATARKLAVIIWNMAVKGEAYINPEGYLFLDQKRKLGLVKRIKKQIDKFALTTDDLGFVSTGYSRCKVSVSQKFSRTLYGKIRMDPILKRELRLKSNGINKQ